MTVRGSVAEARDTALARPWMYRSDVPVVTSGSTVGLPSSCTVVGDVLGSSVGNSAVSVVIGVSAIAIVKGLLKVVETEREIVAII